MNLNHKKRRLRFCPHGEAQAGDELACVHSAVAGTVFGPAALGAVIQRGCIINIKVVSEHAVESDLNRLHGETKVPRGVTAVHGPLGPAGVAGIGAVKHIARKIVDVDGHGQKSVGSGLNGRVAGNRGRPGQI